MNNDIPNNLADSEQERVRDALQKLLTSGAILRQDERDLYEWCRIQRSVVDWFADIIGLKLHWDQENRLILALPQSSKLLRRLRQDETLLALSLWYDFDRAVKDEGRTPDDVRFTVRDFNENLATKFKDLKLPQPTRMREILQLFERKSLIRMCNTADPGGLAEATIHVLPTIRFMIPFQTLGDWEHTRDRYIQAAAAENSLDESED
jgi:hypothetical protein